MRFVKFFMGGAVLAAFLTFGACSNKEQPEEPTPEQEYTEADYAAAATLSSTDENFHHTEEGYALWFGAEGGSATIAVDCGCGWTAAADEDADWLTIELSSDGTSVTVTAEAQETAEASTASSEEADDEAGEESDEESGDESGEDDSARYATITFKTIEEGIEFCPVAVTQSVEEPEYEDEEEEEEEEEEVESDIDFFAVDGYTGEDTQTTFDPSYEDLGVLEDSYSGIYSDFIKSVKAQYTIGGVAYIEYETDTDYLVGLLDDSEDEWTFAAYNYDGEDITTDYWSGVYEITTEDDEGNPTTAVIDNNTYSAVGLYLDSDPEELFYFVWTNGTTGKSYILFFYDPRTDLLPGETYDYAIVVQDSDGNAVTVYDEPQWTIAHNGASAIEELIEEYTGDEYGDLAVGYIAYETGKTFYTSITPFSDSSTWLGEGYQETYSSDGYWFGYDEENGSALNSLSDYVEAKVGTSYLFNGEYYPSVDVECREALPDETSFLYIVYRAAQDDDECVAILFICPTDRTEASVKEFSVTNGNGGGSVTFDTEYKGEYEEYATEIESVLAKYSPDAVGYLHYEGNSDSYNVSFTGATDDDSWSWISDNLYAYTGGGTEVVYYTREVYTDDNGGTATRLVQTVNPDYEDLFEIDGYYINLWFQKTYGLIYLVFNDGDYTYLFFFYDDGQTAEESGDPLTLVYTTTEAATTIKLPVYGTDAHGSGVACTINWGDGSDDESCYGEANPTHEYAAAGTYTVQIYGTVPALNSSFASIGDDIRLTAVTSWGDVGLTSLEYAFSRNTNLTSLPSGGSGLENVTSFLYAFQYCTGLTELPSELFSGCSKAETFKYVFYNCTNLETIPNSIFKGCSGETTFNSAFYNCSALKELPSGLFDDCTNATNFQYAFRGCTTLNTLAGDLFVHCTNVEDYSGAFWGCTGLTSITDNPFSGTYDKCTTLQYFFRGCTNLSSVPASICDGFTKVTNVGYIFYQCEALECESPYTEISDTHVHLYDRSSYSSDFDTPTTYSNAFTDCEKLTDYSSIPDEWK